MRYPALTGAIVLAVVWLITTYHPLPPALIGGGLDCRTTAKPLVRLELLFDSERKNTFPISDEEWAAFLAAEVTPRFPGGLTVWRDAAIRAAYKTRFAQDGVLRADGRRPVCRSDG
jgi:hypothetical protein